MNSKKKDTFIGRSRPEEDLCRHTPRSAAPIIIN